jgi:beta-glucosidase/6-phospho-beta-glucosidase/beta-galactosidase
MAGRLSPEFCPPECVGTQDYVGLDYYWGISALGFHRIARLMDAAAQHYSQAPVWPRVLYDALRRYARMFPGMEILVIENGCVDVASGVAKADYIARHVLEVQRAVADGVPVSAYVCWSITSNREWGLPLGADSDFGLYHIDLDGDPALRRVPTAAAATYREIIARRSAAGVAPPTELRD